ncbi:major facilitator superfamily domain-containing protein 8-like [Mizuhopecten yessoensis]|uniref:Major facilitator superfamily domain-containing protein 8 n=1 Tax=Mizuhopecten yessoensis TaxID=6573 RepID=A0A210Q7Y0_MIZYE|nr:major facilitator superfamily domain-containing protein 8-like [Mizuhopecten yessoensis]OWF44852.1 Major facilitator superfamily domain-containing protein 8 [Mizuhopecten yessoensis]
MSTLKTRKRLSYFNLGLFFLMGGIEYAVVLPTLWLYIQDRFDSPEYMLGIIMSAYSLAAMISSPLLGRWADKSRNPRIIIILCGIVQVGGNFMYFIGLSQWFLLASRLVVGFGAGGGSVIMGEIGRVTTEQERTGIIALLIAIRQCGLLLGPGLNVFLRLTDFHIGPFLVDKFSSPGVFMAAIWALQSLLMVFLYKDLHKIQAESIAEEKRTKKTDTIQNYSSIDNMDSVERDLLHTVNESDQRYMEIHSKTLPQKEPTLSRADNSRLTPVLGETSSSTENLNSQELHELSWRFLYTEYVREEVVVLMAVQFNSYFNQVGFETMITPLSQKFLHWGELENSIMYCCAAAEVIAVFMLVRYLSKRLQDRTMILIGLSTLVLACGWLLYAVPNSDPDKPSTNLPMFIVGLVLDMFALPFLAVCSISLFSKVTKKEHQGLSQGLRRIVVGCGMILGPLWTGSALSWPYIMLGVMLGLLVMSLVMLLLSYGRLDRKEESPVVQSVQADPVYTESNENQPLLS